MVIDVGAFDKVAESDGESLNVCVKAAATAAVPVAVKRQQVQVRSIVVTSVVPLSLCTIVNNSTATCDVSNS